MRRSRHKTVQAVAGTLRCWSLIPEGSRVIVALSGGRDSVALAAILNELAGGTNTANSTGRVSPAPTKTTATARTGINPVPTKATTARTGQSPVPTKTTARRPKFDLLLAHLNHGLRPSAARDEGFVISLARQWGLPLVVERADVAQAARREGLGIEEAARVVRYEFLESVALEADARFVAVGHHSDDQAETVLMNFLRGSALRGLAGMPIRRPIAPGSPVTLVRPLLEVNRAALEDYLRVRELTWVEDETNHSTKMMRNRVRNELLPLLEREYAPGLRGRLVKSAEQDAAVQEFLAQRAAAAWETVTVSAAPLVVEFRLEALQAQGRAVSCELLLAAMERLGAGRRDLAAEHLSAAWEMISGTKGGGTVEFPGGVRLLRRGDTVRVMVD